MKKIVICLAITFGVIGTALHARDITVSVSPFFKTPITLTVKYKLAGSKTAADCEQATLEIKNINSSPGKGRSLSIPRSIGASTFGRGGYQACTIEAIEHTAGGSHSKIFDAASHDAAGV